MFLSKIWFVLVGLLAAVAMTAAFVAPRPADRQIEQLEGQRLDRAQYAAEQMLKTDAHRWIDYVAKLGRDAVISEALDSASRGAGEAKILHATVQKRLQALIPNFEAIGLVGAGAVDGKGRVVGRIGLKEKVHGEDIGGAEVIADALRGYVTDDVWTTGGALQRIAAAPVISKGRDRIVGVIYVAAETGERLAKLWKRNLGVEVAVLLRKQVLTATVPDAVLAGLPELIDGHRQEIASALRTRALSLPMGSDRLLAVAAPFTGQAGRQDAYYVLLGRKAPASNPFALLSNTAADDLAWGNFPWLSLGAGMILILGVGLWLQRYEMDGPLSRLRKDLQRLSRGELVKIDDTRYPGKFGGIAREVNAAMERLTPSPSASRSEIARRDLNAVLEGAPSDQNAQGLSPFDPRMRNFTPVESTSPPSTLSAPPAGFAPGLTPFSSPPGSAPPRLPSAGMTPPPATPSPFSVPPPRPWTTGNLPAPGGSPFATPPPPRNASASMPSPPAPPPTPGVSRPSPLPALLQDSPTADGPPFDVAFNQELDDNATAEMAGDERTRAVEPMDTEEAHLREVFADYVSARKSTGEPVGSLTLDKFRVKIESNRQQLIAKYGCRTARFSVYVKDGKAAIKATPVRD